MRLSGIGQLSKKNSQKKHIICLFLCCPFLGAHNLSAQYVCSGHQLSWQAWSATEGCLHRGLAGYVIKRFKRTSASRPGLYTLSVDLYISACITLQILAYIAYAQYIINIYYSLGMFGDVFLDSSLAQSPTLEAQSREHGYAESHSSCQAPGSSNPAKVS